MDAMTIKCKTCKYWIKADDSICNPFDEDTLEPIAMGYEVRECKQPTQTFCKPPVERNGFALADGEEYAAHLYTAEDFGCVRHTPETPAS